MTIGFNNCPIKQCDKRERLLAVLKPGVQLSREAWANRAGIPFRTATYHMHRLHANGQVVKSRWNGRWVFMRSALAHGNRRKASVSYAGYMEFGRGYANW